MSDRRLDVIALRCVASLNLDVFRQSESLRRPAVDRNGLECFDFRGILR